MKPIEKAVEILGSAAAVGRACKQKPQAVNRWLRSGRVPAHHCLNIELATQGNVTRHQLRPDVFGNEPVVVAAADSARAA